MAISSALFTSNREDWETPQTLFDALNDKYSFTLDPCSTHANAKCAKHYTKDENGLAQSWAGERVFCNPPYGKAIADWVAKCHAESEKALVVALLPARTDTAYFHEHIYKIADVQFLRGRVKFELGGGGFKASTVSVYVS